MLRLATSMKHTLMAAPIFSRAPATRLLSICVIILVFRCLLYWQLYSLSLAQSWCWCWCSNIFRLSIECSTSPCRCPLSPAIYPTLCKRLPICTRTLLCDAFIRYLLSKVEAAQRAVSGVTIFDNVLHLTSPSAPQSVAITSNDVTEKKPAAANNLPDWEREGRLWNALEVMLLSLCSGVRVLHLMRRQNRSAHRSSGETG